MKDTGVGIAKPEQELVFERFHRVEGTARSHEGTGEEWCWLEHALGS